MAPTKVILLALLLALVNLAKSETKPKIDEKTSFQPRPPILAGNGAQTFGTPTGGVVGGDSYYPGNNNNNGYPPYNNNGNNGNNGFYPDDTIGNGNLVAFSVNRAARYTQSAPSTVQFERIITDIGYGWDPNTSSFQVRTNNKSLELSLILWVFFSATILVSMCSAGQESPPPITSSGWP